MSVDGYRLWMLINVMNAVSFRGHDANFYEHEARF